MVEPPEPKVIHPGSNASEGDGMSSVVNGVSQSDPASGPVVIGPNGSSDSGGPTSNGLGKRLRAMPKVLVAQIVVALVIIGVVIALFGSHKQSAVAYTGGQVSISASSFFPKTITIKAGQQITWTNHDSRPHWIASDPYPKDDGFAALNSGGALRQGDSYSLSFTKAGTYTYHDNLNPFKLQGTVVVK